VKVQVQVQKGPGIVNSLIFLILSLRTQHSSFNIWRNAPQVAERGNGNCRFPIPVYIQPCPASALQEKAKKIVQIKIFYNPSENTINPASRFLRETLSSVTPRLLIL